MPPLPFHWILVCLWPWPKPWGHLGHLSGLPARVFPWTCPLWLLCSGFLDLLSVVAAFVSGFLDLLSVAPVASVSGFLDLLSAAGFVLDLLSAAFVFGFLALLSAASRSGCSVLLSAVAGSGFLSFVSAAGLPSLSAAVEFSFSAGASFRCRSFHGNPVICGPPFVLFLPNHFACLAALSCSSVPVQGSQRNPKEGTKTSDRNYVTLEFGVPKQPEMS